MLRASLMLLVLAALPGAAAPAAAATPSTTTAPPGNSAIDEYVETVPGVSGDVRPRAPGETTPLTPAQQAELAAGGADGRTLARVVEATAPPPRATAPAPRAGPTPAASAPSSAGRSPLAAALVATTGRHDGSALGPLLPALLLASVVAVVVLARSRRRRSRP